MTGKKIPAILGRVIGQILIIVFFSTVTHSASFVLIGMVLAFSSYILPPLSRAAKKGSFLFPAGVFFVGLVFICLGSVGWFSFLDGIFLNTSKADFPNFWDAMRLRGNLPEEQRGLIVSGYFVSLLGLFFLQVLFDGMLSKKKEL
jgi:hypothetical protein